MADADLRVRDLHAYYGTAHILFGVDLDVPAGTTLALLGRNGAGKTTLLRSVANAGVTTTGTVTYAGHRLSSLPSYRVARAGVQLVPDDRRIFTGLSVRENLDLGIRATRGAGSGRSPLPRERVLDLFPMLRPLLDRGGHALSGGEQQCLAIARAMVANPTLLLLDEPSEGLAPLIVEQVGAALARLRAEFDLTVLLAEQNTRFAVELADSVAVIDGGALVFTGSRDDFATQDDLRRRYLAV
ncbi:MAG TPA: ABC transporter ATP-binding protein [Mycobacteriales bacterium]|nr:ABC transporter ATP-binding protein [Mycobacteriales bacterium]